METALALALTVGPIALILALLLRTVRRRTSRRQAPQAGPGGPFRGPGGRGRNAGDRSPTRPRVPSLSGGAALDLPVGDEVIDETFESLRIAAATSPAPDRLAG